MMEKSAHNVALFFSSIALIIGVQACSPGENPKQDMTATERLRLQVPPQVGRWMGQAEVAFQRGNYNLAFALMDSVEYVVPDLADAHFMRGRLFTKVNDLEMSQISYERTLQLDPAYPGAHFNMGLNAFRRGLLRQAVNYYFKEEEVNPDPDAVLYLEWGKTYAQLGEPDSAQAAYEKAIEIQPDNPTTYMWLGQLMEEIGELDKALEYSHQGAELRPDDPDYEYIIGSLYFRKGDTEKAFEYLEPIVDKMEFHQGVQYNYGQVLRRLGREEEAQIYLARADSAQQLQQMVNDAVIGVNNDPQDRDKWVGLAMLLWKTGQQERAIESYMTAVNIDPANPGLQSNLAMMLVESGRFEDGIRRYETILRIWPELTDVWLNLGAAYANAGDADKARSAWEKVLELDPDNGRANDNLSRLQS